MIAGALIVGIYIMVRIVVMPERAAHAEQLKLERERNTRQEEEIKRLNQTFIEQAIPAIIHATTSITENTDLLIEMQKKQEEERRQAELREARRQERGDRNERDR